MSTRILYVDPNNLDNNPITNVPVNLEDLSIFVSLETTQKPRGQIKDSTYTTSGGKYGKINFLDGSQAGPNECDRSLTTSYTDINSDFQTTDDFEGFGMESIDITFDTAYTPIIKIKFIDIRGGMLSRGNNSKYSFFFNLPYPIFSLTVKGYYGKAVTYCLHMTKWNANFNSQTGNFEIDAEFIGYTYAMLTDLLMGYMRAIPYTTVGKTVFNEVINEYKAKAVAGDNFSEITIDDMIRLIGEIKQELQQIQTNSPAFQMVTKIDNDNKVIKQIKDVHAKFLLELNGDDRNNIVDGNDIYSLIIEPNSAAINTRNNDIKNLLGNLDSKGNLEDSYDIITESDKLDIDKFNTVGGNADNYLIANSKYTKSDTRRVVEIVKIINESTPDKKKLLKANRFYVYDYIGFNQSINNYLTEHERTRQLKITEFSENLRGELITTYDFDPTIKNIFRILLISAETYFRTINKVCVKAEERSNTDRYAELDRLIGNLDVKASSDIYAFPTYYNDSGEETWLGTKVSDSVTEVAFTKELLDALVKSKQQELLLDQSAVREWFCLGTIDTPLVNNPVKASLNPYSLIIGADQTPHYLMRQLMYRMFTYLSFSIDPDMVDERVIEYMGKFEANNMFYGVTKTETRENISTDFTNADKIIEHFETGSNQIKNNQGKYVAKPYMVKTGDNYEYKYIQSGFRSYIPIYSQDKAIYGGEPFFISGTDTLLSKEEISKKWADNLFIGSYERGDGDIYTGGTQPATLERTDDGGKYLDIISEGDYDNPTFNLPKDRAERVVDDYKKNYITSDAKLKQSSIAGKTLKLSKLDLLARKFYVNNYDSAEIEPGGVNTDEKIQSSDKNDISQIFYVNGPRYGTRLGIIANTITAADKYKYNFLKENSGTNMYYYSNAINYKLGTDELVTFGEPSFGGNIYSDSINLYSLFGSQFYYGQNATYSNPLYAKSYLFLNTLPLRGILGDFDGTPYKSRTEAELLDTLFASADDNYHSTETIKGMFSKVSSFIKTPDLWIAWVGSVLWRYEEYLGNDFDPIVTGGIYTGTTTPLVPNVTDYPTYLELFNNTEEDYLATEDVKTPMFFIGDGFGIGNPAKFKRVDKTLLNLPQSVKDDFTTFFTEWSDNEFNNKIKENLQIFTDDIVDNSGDNIAKLETWNAVSQLLVTGNATPLTGSKPSNSYLIYQDVDISGLTSNTFIRNDAAIKSVTPLVNIINNQTTISQRLNIDYSNTRLQQEFSNVIKAVSIIANHTPRIWGEKYDFGSDSSPFFIKEDYVKKYLDAFAQEYEKLQKDFLEQQDADNVKSGVFGTTNNEFILLNIYRHLSAIKTKWLGGVSSDSTMFYPCGSVTDDKSLFDRFQFINKAFTDIGDDFLINPTVVSDLIIKNQNKSFFDVISNLLANNNFNFIPLPTYIDFNSQDSMNQVFKPLSYIDYITSSSGQTVGPSFICMYVGQTSTHLDIKGSDHENDGIDLYVDDCNGTTRKDEEFNKDDDGTGKYKNKIPVFEVNYGQQNQNYFKDVRLDQREFVETQESLIIINEISKSGDKNNDSFIGQNLFNVYQTRSYSAEIEAVGMPLIQPIMYFQLNNIPMFRGGYLIIRTEHNIKANHMTTKFKGVRVKDVRTPLNKTVFALKEFNTTETGDSDQLKYVIRPSDINNTGSNSVPVSDVTDADIYNHNYNQYANSLINADFDKPSNTIFSGTALTYNEIFEIAATATGVDAKVLKCVSFIESTIGQNKDGKSNRSGNEGINGSGYVGLMQFGVDASNDINNITSQLLFALPDFTDYTFKADLDEVNKKLKIPASQSTATTINNLTTNSLFDDLVSAIAAAEYGKKVLGGRAPQVTPIDVRDMYLSFQQGKGGFNTILKHLTNRLDDGSSTSNNMNGNKPFVPAAPYEFEVWQSWLDGWSGKVQKVFDKVVGPSANSLNPLTTPNADKLRVVLANLGYTEKNKSISENGDISVSMEKYASAIFTKIKQEYSSYGIIVTAGNDSSHRNSAARHPKGNAIDFILLRPNGTDVINTPSRPSVSVSSDFENGKILPNDAPTYIPSDATIISNVEKIIQGYVVTSGDKFIYLDEYNYPTPHANGPHFHISYDPAGRGTEGITIYSAQPPMMPNGFTRDNYVVSTNALNAGTITAYNV